MKELSKIQAQTRQNFINALQELLSEKPLDKITVKDITEKAGYNRSSFYLYFIDVYELAEAAEDQLIEMLSTEIRLQIDAMEPPSIELFISELALKVSFYLESFHTFMESKSFQKKYLALLKTTFSKLSGFDQNNPYYDFVTSLLFSIMMHNLSYLHQHLGEYTPEEIILITKELMLPGIMSLKQKENFHP